MASKQVKKSTPKSKNSGVKKIKLLITIVDRNKADLYVNLLEDFEVNIQLVLHGNGTVDNETLELLGLQEKDKAVIISCIKVDNEKKILDFLDEKFEKIKNGKGIAFTVPMSSVIGVMVYRFLSNQK